MLSKFSISFSVDEKYDILKVEKKIAELTEGWRAHDYRFKNINWAMAYEPYLLPGAIEYCIDGKTLSSIFQHPLEFRPESLVDHAYQLLWGSAMTQSFQKPFTLYFDEMGVSFSLEQDGSKLTMRPENDLLEDLIFELDVLQFLGAVSEHYGSIVKTLLQTHKTLEANKDFIRGIPLIQFVDPYKSLLSIGASET